MQKIASGRAMDIEPDIPLRKAALELRKIGRFKEHAYAVNALLKMLQKGALRASVTLPSERLPWMPISTSHWRRCQSEQFKIIIRNRKHHGRTGVYILPPIDAIIELIYNFRHNPADLYGDKIDAEAFVEDMDSLILRIRDGIEVIILSSDWKKFCKAYYPTKQAITFFSKKGRPESTFWKEIEAAIEEIERGNQVLGKKCSMKDTANKAIEGVCKKLGLPRTALPSDPPIRRRVGAVRKRLETPKPHSD